MGYSKVAIVGNCQALPIAEHLTAAIPELNLAVLRAKADDDITFLVEDFDLVFLQSQKIDRADGVIRYPCINFTGFQPDMCYLKNPQSNLTYRSPLWNYHSAIVAAAFCLGLPRKRAIDLFNAYIYAQLGYFGAYHSALVLSLEDWKTNGIELGESVIDEWKKAGSFMHTINHPAKLVTASIARYLIEKAGLVAIRNVEVAHDRMEEGVVWPVYPEIARRLDVYGDMIFKRDSRHVQQKNLSRTMTLDEFVKESFKWLTKIPVEHIELSKRVALAKGVLQKELH